MRARQLEVFVTMMRAGTVTAAARILNISQPALSQILLHTEDELGFALFDRVKGRLHPTPEALELLPDTERIFTELEGLRRKAAELRIGSAGLVRVAAPPPPAMTILPRAVAEFRARHPNIVLRSQIAPLRTVIEMLRSGDAHLGLGLQDRLPPDIGVEILGRTRFVCLLPEGHWLTAKPELELADLSGEVLISYRRDTRPAEELSLAARARGVSFSPALEIDVSLSAIGFVQAGLGVAVVDALLPWQQFSGVQLRPLASSPELPVSLLTSHTRTLSLAEEMFRDEIRVASAEIL
jgi:DNA-binding transcriptional LysR family regulator